MAIDLPPWLKGADVGAEYSRGLAIGASLREARERLAAASQEASIRTQQEQQRLQQEHDVQQQRLAVTQAYQQQVVALRKQQLDNVAAVNAQKTANAARQFSARQNLANDFQSIDQREDITDEQKDTLKRTALLRRAPEMGMPGTAVGPMFRDLVPPKATVPATVDSTSNPNFTIVTNPNGSKVLHPNPKPAKQPQATIPQLKAAMDATDDEDTKTALQKRINQMAKSAVNVPQGTSDYTSKSDVVAAYRSGSLSRADATRILKDQFGVSE